jgi:hypothetical protein
MKNLLFLSTVAAGTLVGCFECPMALAEADKSLLAMGDAFFSAVDGGRGSPSIILKRWPLARCRVGRALPLLASTKAIGRLRVIFSQTFCCCYEKEMECWGLMWSTSWRMTMTKNKNCTNKDRVSSWNTTWYWTWSSARQ